MANLVVVDGEVGIDDVFQQIRAAVTALMSEA